MPSYKAPLRDMSYIIRELFDFETIQALPAFKETSSDLIDAIFNEAAKFCETVLFPLNQTGDEEGCHLINGEVHTPKGFKEAYRQSVENGWLSLTCDPNYGGQGLPESIAVFVQEMICSGNLAFSLYPGLTSGAYTLLYAHGSEDLKKKFLPQLVSGKWSGTMNLTEPQCGTDLGLLRTRAEPQKDGSYLITGTKIFISSGDHDLAENIIHLVLARTPNAPRGTKGISLFLVPKIQVKEDGSLGSRNHVNCASLEHKMGIKGSSTCVLNYEGATGYLVGELNKGLNHMFTMMNSERLAVGVQGLSISEVAYQNALAYARERLQGRALTGAKYPDKPADPLMVHPDIRKTLLTIRAYNEGNRMLAGWVARQLDFAHHGKTDQEKQDADDFIQLITPIVKAFFTDTGFECTNLALQIHGGYGYIRDYGMEQYVRDARIAQIYEGTNGIQALDLVGRKLPMHTGRCLRQFFHPVLSFIDFYQQDPEWEEFITPLAKAVNRLQRASLHIAIKGLFNPDEAGAAAADFLSLFGHTALAYLWTKSAMIAKGKEDPFYQGKLKTARFYMQKILPKTSGLFANIVAGSDPLMSIKDEEFGPFLLT